MSRICNLTHAYLTKRDGSITRDGAAMARIAKRTGYSVESLRSIAYGRREPANGSERRRKLYQAVRNG